MITWTFVTTAAIQDQSYSSSGFNSVSAFPSISQQGSAVIYSDGFISSNSGADFKSDGTGSSTTENGVTDSVNGSTSFHSEFFSSASANIASGTFTSTSSSTTFTDSAINQTTQSATTSLSISTSETGVFSSSYITSGTSSGSTTSSATSTTATFSTTTSTSSSILTSTASYSNVSGTSSTISGLSVIVTTLTIQAPMVGSVIGTGYLPETIHNEVLWYWFSSGTMDLLSNLSSTVGSLTYAGHTLSIGSSETGTFSYFHQSATTSSVAEISQSSGTTIVSISDFTHGGFLTIPATTFIDYTTSTFYNTTISSSLSSSGPAFTYVDIFTISETVSALSALGSTLECSTGSFSGFISTISITSIITETITSAGISGAGEGPTSSSTIITSPVETEVAFNSAGYSGGIVVIQGADLILNTTASASGILKQPGLGFRITPEDGLVEEISLGGGVIAASWDGGYAQEDSRGIQTVPIQYPGLRNWQDSNSISYTASWNGVSLSVTSKSASTATTSSQTVQWSGVSSITQTLFKQKGDGFIARVGSGTYPDTISSSPNTLALPQGAFARESSTEIVSGFSSETITTSDFARSLAYASVVPGFGQPITVESRTIL